MQLAVQLEQLESKISFLELQRHTSSSSEGKVKLIRLLESAASGAVAAAARE